MDKICSKCNQVKDLDLFSRAARGSFGRSAWCKECAAKYQRTYRPHWISRDPLNRAKANENSRRSMRKARDLVIDTYGGKCSCCGESRRNFLSLEHINGGGTKHRRAVRKQLWPSIIREGFPKDKYSILCFNCNCSRGFYGYCCKSPQVVLQQ